MPPTTTSSLFRRAAMLLALALAATLAPIVGPGAAAAGPLTAGGWTTSATASPAQVSRGGAAVISVSVMATARVNALIDVEVYDAQGNMVAQRFWDAQSFRNGRQRNYQFSWTVPGSETAGTHTVKIGVFGAGWAGLQHWNNDATTFQVVSASGTTTTTAPATTTTTAPPATTTTTTTTTTVPPSGRFPTLPVGAALPSDAECAARVRPAAEIRPANSTYNQTRGARNPSAQGIYARVSGNFAGTTDEIIQWASCKWGIDEDIVRAQTAKESWWFQRAGGDFTTDPSRCAPGHGFGVDGRPGLCAESVGVQQVRYPYHQIAFPWATTSTAHNLDYALAVRRSCFEGYDTWFNNVERGREYAAGDIWGCVGAWFSGRWYTQPSVEYIAAVQDYLNQRIWATPVFINAS